MFRRKAGRILGALSFGAVSMAAMPSTLRLADVSGPETRLPAAGVTFDITTINAAAQSSTTITGKGMAGPDGGVRIDITAIDGPSTYAAVGDYYISRNGGLILVKPTTKTFVDMLEVNANAGIPPQAMASAAISGIEGTSETIAGSETIDGRATQHVRTKVSYTLGLGPMTVPSTVTSDFWLAKVSVPMINPLSGLKMPVTTGPMVDLVKKQMELYPAASAGVALKAVVVTTRAAMGQTQTTTQTTELKNLKDGNVDVSKIAVPEGFTKAAR